MKLYVSEAVYNSKVNAVEYKRLHTFTSYGEAEFSFQNLADRGRAVAFGFSDVKTYNVGYIAETKAYREEHLKVID